MRGSTLVAALVLLASACSSGDVTLPAVIGDWVLEGGTTGGGPFPIVDGHRITMNFADDGTVGGVAACNSYGGTYIADAEDLIIGGDMSSTAMGCPDPGVMESESAFLAILREPLAYVVNGDDLTVTHSSGELAFSRVQPVASADLVDTPWRLETVIEGDTATSVEGDATLALGADGSVSGSTGCRTFSGAHTIDADTVHFTTFTMAGDCPDELGHQDRVIVNVLGDGFTTEIEGDLLTLSSAGQHGLVYRRDA